MSRVRLASLLTVALAVSGAWAMPSRVVESVRLITSVAWVEHDQARAEIRYDLARPVRGHRIPPIGRPAPAPARPTSLPHSLYQRPPPNA